MPLSYDNIFRIIIMQFIDAHSFDVRSVKKTCVHIVHPDGRLIPFDTYNLFYRDQSGTNPPRPFTEECGNGSGRDLRGLGPSTNAVGTASTPEPPTVGTKKVNTEGTIGIHLPLRDQVLDRIAVSVKQSSPKQALLDHPH
jgi:hypothetical protein